MGARTIPAPRGSVFINALSSSSKEREGLEEMPRYSLATLGSTYDWELEVWRVENGGWGEKDTEEFGGETVNLNIYTSH